MEAHDKRMEAHDKRMGAYEKRMAASDARMDRFEKGLNGLRVLVASGMRVVNHTAEDNRALKSEVRKLAAEVRTLIKTRGNGHVGGTNGRGRAA